MSHSNHILNQIPNFIFWKDMNFEYLGANDIFVKNAGLRSIDDILGKNDYQMPWECFANKYRDDDRYILIRKKHLRIEEQHKDISGHISIVVVNKKPLYDVNGDVIGIIGTYSHLYQPKDKILLPKRQKEVLIGIAKGKTAKAIANELSLSIRTVESYIDIIKSKLGCRNKAQLIKAGLSMCHQSLSSDLQANFF